MSKDAAQRKREERERMRANGYTLFQTWVKPEWIPKIKRLIERLGNKERK